MRFARLTALLTVLAVLCAACGGSSRPAPHGVLKSSVDPGFVHGTDHSDGDRLAATVVTDVQDYWRQAFPTTFGKPWQDLAGGFYSVDSAHTGSPPPCAGTTEDVAGDAFYCPDSDAVVCDRAALLPVLRDELGAPAVAAVLAHEIGHAVQRRAGLTGSQGSAGRPPGVIEAMADCFAGGFARWVTGGHSPHLRMTHQDLDSMLSALVVLRDPAGTAAGTHGDAFDRVSAFTEGYQHGPKRCAGMTARNHRFTQRSLAARRPIPTVSWQDGLRQAAAQLRSYFGTVVAGGGATWRPPALSFHGKGRCDAAQGPIAWCAARDEIDIRTGGTLKGIRAEIGDYGAVTLLVSRYAVAAITATGQPATGARTLCLTGAFLGARLGSLSTGDLDAAVRAILRYDYASRDIAGHHTGAGFDRLIAFGHGIDGGASACSR